MGLMRSGSIVYIAVFSNTNDHRFPIEQSCIEILPSAIRLKELERDMFIRQVSDDHRYSAMMREIKVILKKDKLKKTSKAEALDRFIASIPPFSAYVKRQRMESKSVKICGLQEVPKQLWSRNSLHEITLSECNLTNVPKQLETFSSTLVYLNLSGNKIDKLPRTFCCRMNNLKQLDLSHNQIETLPIEIKFFRKLVELNISNNCLRMLPSTFSDLKSLRKLNVATNNLSQLPAFKKEDIRLQYLDVSYNPLDGALNEASTFEVCPSSIDGTLGYDENLFRPLNSISKSKFPTLYELSMLNIVRCDKLLRLASSESLPRTIVSMMQRDIFKCYKCSRMSILPAYNSTDILDYVEQVEELISTGNYRHGMTFMKLLCRSCFDNMSS